MKDLNLKTCEELFIETTISNNNVFIKANTCLNNETPILMKVIVIIMCFI